jgi:glutaredoxin
MDIKFYGSDWCPDCIRSKAFLDKNKISYEYIDVEKTDGAAEIVVEINKKFGKGPFRSLPTILLDGKIVLTEPTNDQLKKAIGV